MDPDEISTTSGESREDFDPFVDTLVLSLWTLGYVVSFVTETLDEGLSLGFCPKLDHCGAPIRDVLSDFSTTHTSLSARQEHSGVLPWWKIFRVPSHLPS
jgi:hypothetical protein